MVLLHKGVRLLISIHAPREGGDNVISTLAPAVGISIHAPREGGDLAACVGRVSADRFQSTPPARGATLRKFVDH